MVQLSQIHVFGFAKKTDIGQSMQNYRQPVVPSTHLQIVKPQAQILVRGLTKN